MTLMDIEKNDVDVSQLFTYKDKITLEIPGTEDAITFYQRIVGDEFYNIARTHALRASAELRENLRNPKWKDRVIYLPKLSRFKKAELLDLVISLELNEITVETINEIDIPIPPDPAGDATQEELEIWQKAQDDYSKKYLEKTQEVMKKKMGERRKKYNKYTRDQIEQGYILALINKYTNELFTKVLQEMTAYYGTYVDEDYKTRAWKTFEDFENAPTTLKKVLIANYVKMELNVQTLKKLQGVTP